MKLAFFASHGGSNMQAILKACQSGQIAATPALLICNNRNATALERAKKFEMPTVILNGKTHPDETDLDHAILEALQTSGADLIILAGYMKKIGSKTLAAYRNRIINIHPALLPLYGGKGMYGMNVHEAVIAAGETQSGATVHLVDDEYDTGPILSQAKVPVLPEDTPETLQRRVLVQEHILFPDTISKVASGSIKLPE